MNDILSEYTPKKTPRRQVNLRGDTYEALSVIAKRNGLSRAGVVEALIKLYNEQANQTMTPLETSTPVTPSKGESPVKKPVLTPRQQREAQDRQRKALQLRSRRQGKTASKPTPR